MLQSGRNMWQSVFNKTFGIIVARDVRYSEKSTVLAPGTRGVKADRHVTEVSMLSQSAGSSCHSNTSHLGGKFIPVLPCDTLVI